MDRPTEAARETAAGPEAPEKTVAPGPAGSRFADPADATRRLPRRIDSGLRHWNGD